MKIEHILVATDLSSMAPSVYRHAAALARRLCLLEGLVHQSIHGIDVGVAIGPVSGRIVRVPRHLRIGPLPAPEVPSSHLRPHQSVLFGHLDRARVIGRRTDEGDALGLPVARQRFADRIRSPADNERRRRDNHAEKL